MLNDNHPHANLNFAGLCAFPMFPKKKNFAEIQPKQENLISITYSP